AGLFHKGINDPAPGALAEKAIGRRTDPAIGVLEHLHQTRRVPRIKPEGWKVRGLLVLDAPDAREVMVPVRARGGVVRAVCRATGVVVDRDLVVEIDKVHRAVRTDAAVDWLEPVVRAGQEVRLLPA